jgi:hypothetical protein
MSSLDLSAAFDVVNIELLIKRLVIAGFPMDVVDLIRVWLKKGFIGSALKERTPPYTISS